MKKIKSYHILIVAEAKSIEKHIEVEFEGGGTIIFDYPYHLSFNQMNIELKMTYLSEMVSKIQKEERYKKLLDILSDV